MPAAWPLSGEKASPESTSAQTSSRAVAAAKMERSMLVFPVDGRPKISVMAPRGRPPVFASNAAIPVDTVSRTRLLRSVKGVDIRPPRTVSNWARRDICSNRDGHRYTVHLFGSQGGENRGLAPLAPIFENRARGARPRFPWRRRHNRLQLR